MSHYGRHVIGLLFLLMVAAAPLQARVVPPDPLAAPGNCAVFVVEEDGRTRAARVRLKRPDNRRNVGELHGMVGYRYRDAAGRERFDTSISASVSAAVLTDELTPVTFDFSAEPIPPSAHRRTFRIIHHEAEGVATEVLREYRAEQIWLEHHLGEISQPAAASPRNGTPVAGPYTVIRERGRPVEEEITFGVDDPAAPWELRLTNGAADGTNRVSAAVVRLNGTELFRPADFNQHVAGLVRPLAVRPGENRLTLTLRSTPGGRVTVEIVKLDGKNCRAFGPQTFIRATGKPKPVHLEFPLAADLTGPYTLEVTSGKADGSHRADAAVVVLNGVVVVSPCELNEQVGRLVVPVTLEPVNTLSVELRGKPGDRLSLEGTGYDNNPPAITVSDPVGGAIVTATPVTVRGTVNDPSAVVTVNGVPAGVTPDGAFAVEGIALDEGENLLTVVAVDACGNRAEEHLAVVLQTLPQGPLLTFCAEPFREQTPLPPETTCNNKILQNSYGLVVGLVDETVETVTLNGVVLPDGVELADQDFINMAMREGNFFWAFVNLPREDGVHAYTATATNAAGETSQATVSFVTDYTPPRLTIAAPASRSVVNATSVTIIGTVDDPEAVVRLGYNGTKLPVVDGAFRVEVPISREGSINLVIYATDPSLNSSSAYLTIIRDTTVPELIVSSPVEGGFVGNPTVPVTVIMDDDNPGVPTVSVNGGVPQALSFAGGKFVGTVILSDGANLLTVQGVDLAGNAAAAVTRTVHLDRQPPAALILEPTPDDELTGVVTVNVAANDDQAGVASIALLVDGKLLATLTQPPFTTQMDTLMIAAGTRMLTARVLDRVGNAAEASIPVAVAPQLRVEIDTPLSGALLDQHAAVVWGTVRRNDEQEVGVTVNGQVAHLWKKAFAALVPLQPGENTLTVTAAATSGLTAAGAVTVTAPNGAGQLRLSAFPTSGIMTLQPNGSEALVTTLAVDASLPGEIVNYAWDCFGTGRIDREGPALAELTFSYFAPGYYFPTVTVTDSFGNTARATVLVHVVDRVELDALLQGKWAGMKQKLVAGDVEAALNSVVSWREHDYRELFGKLAGRFPAIFAPPDTLSLSSGYEEQYVYDNLVVEGDKVFSYPVRFVRDVDGILRIRQF